MARTFTTKDAKRLQEEYDDLRNQFQRLETLQGLYRRTIKDSAEYLVTQEIMRILRDVPVDEINRDKLGIRVKTLRDNGYRSIADIISSSEYQISSIQGITYEKALLIKK